MSERHCLDDATELEHEDLTVPGFDAHRAILEAFAAPMERRVARIVTDSHWLIRVEPSGALGAGVLHGIVERDPRIAVVVDARSATGLGLQWQNIATQEVVSVMIASAQQFGWRLDRLSSVEAVLSKEE